MSKFILDFVTGRTAFKAKTNFNDLNIPVADFVSIDHANGAYIMWYKKKLEDVDIKKLEEAKKVNAANKIKDLMKLEKNKLNRINDQRLAKGLNILLELPVSERLFERTVYIDNKPEPKPKAKRPAIKAKVEKPIRKGRKK